MTIHLMASDREVLVYEGVAPSTGDSFVLERPHTSFNVINGGVQHKIIEGVQHIYVQGYVSSPESRAKYSQES